MKRNLAAGLLALMTLAMATSQAKADLKLCNNTASSVSIAIGYKDKEGWASEGWWTAKPTACISLLKGALIARYYYVYAVDREKGGSWGGKAQICTRDKIFTIRGLENCAERGFQKQGFFEVDTGEKTDWTVSLSADKPPPAAGTQQPAPLPDPTAPPANNTQQGQ